jgi:ribosomal protein S18 acetylase RimI-like enzyme
MARAAGPKTTVLGRVHDTPSGTAFGAIYDGTAMLHAIETTHAFRRQGLGRHMIRALAFWAQERDAHTISLLVTKANVAANALYTSLGMTPVGGYHYRIHPEA